MSDDHVEFAERKPSVSKRPCYSELTCWFNDRFWQEQQQINIKKLKYTQQQLGTYLNKKGTPQLGYPRVTLDLVILKAPFIILVLK